MSSIAANLREKRPDSNPLILTIQAIGNGPTCSFRFHNRTTLLGYKATSCMSKPGQWVQHQSIRFNGQKSTFYSFFESWDLVVSNDIVTPSPRLGWWKRSRLPSTKVATMKSSLWDWMVLKNWFVFNLIYVKILTQNSDLYNIRFSTAQGWNRWKRPFLDSWFGHSFKSCSSTCSWRSSYHCWWSLQWQR